MYMVVGVYSWAGHVIWDELFSSLLSRDRWRHQDGSVPLPYKPHPRASPPFITVYINWMFLSALYPFTMNPSHCTSNLIENQPASTRSQHYYAIVDRMSEARRVLARLENYITRHDCRGLFATVMAYRPHRPEASELNMMLFSFEQMDIVVCWLMYQRCEVHLEVTMY